MAGFGIIDTPVNVTRFLPRLTGTHTIIRYITRGAPNGSKHVKVPEIRAIKAAGKKLALVHQTYGYISHAGRGGVSRIDGERDGPYARRILPSLGAPAGACVYFAVDQDVSAAQMRSHVVPYFTAIKPAFADGEYRIGVYGPGSVCRKLKDAGLVDLCWLSNAKGWSGYNAFKPHADIVQRLPTKIAGGLDVDPNDAQVEDWGQFEPFAQDQDFRVAEGDDPSLDQDETVTAAVTPRLGAGEPDGESSIETFTTVASAAGGLGLFGKLKNLFKGRGASFVAGAATGTTGTATTANDPSLLSNPIFWMTIVLAVLGAAVVYLVFTRK